MDGELPVDGVLTFGWASRNVVVITRSMAEQIAARYAIDPEGIQAWWNRLLGHELEFHVGKHPRHTGHRHDTDSAAIADEWFLWQPRHPRADLTALTNESRRLDELERLALAGWSGDPARVRVPPIEVIARLLGTERGTALTGVIAVQLPDASGVLPLAEDALAEAIELSYGLLREGFERGTARWERASGPLAGDWLIRVLDRNDTTPGLVAERTYARLVHRFEQRANWLLVERYLLPDERRISANEDEPRFSLGRPVHTGMAIFERLSSWLAEARSPSSSLDWDHEAVDARTQDVYQWTTLLTRAAALAQPWRRRPEVNEAREAVRDARQLAREAGVTYAELPHAVRQRPGPRLNSTIELVRVILDEAPRRADRAAEVLDTMAELLPEQARTQTNPTEANTIGLAEVTASIAAPRQRLDAIPTAWWDAATLAEPQRNTALLHALEQWTQDRAADHRADELPALIRAIQGVVQLINNLIDTDGAFSERPLPHAVKDLLRVVVPELPRRAPTKAERRVLPADLDPSIEVMPAAGVARLASGEFGTPVTGWSAYTRAGPDGWITVLSEEAPRVHPHPAF